MASVRKRVPPWRWTVKRFRLEDLPERVRAQVEVQLADYSRPISPLRPQNASRHTDIATGEKKADGGATRRCSGHSKGPNKTEKAYLDQKLRGKDARFEALTFRMSNGHRYTPDWVVFEAGRPIECHEVKGGYAFRSQQRARLAFDQARVEFPGLRWVWARKTDGGWEVAK